MRPDVVCRLDRLGRLLYVNSALEQILGYAPREAVGMQVQSLVIPEFRDCFEAALGRQIDEGIRISRLAFPFVAKDGSAVWMDQSIQLIKREGVVVGFKSVAREVTRSRTQDEMLERSAEFPVALASTEDLMMVVDDEGRIRFATSSVETGLGYAAREVRGRFLAGIVHPDDRERLGLLLQAAGEGTVQTAPLEVRLRHAEGKWHAHEMRVSGRLPDPGGGDVVLTARHAARPHRIPESLGILQLALDRMHMGVTVTDLDDRIRYVNRTEAEMHGYTVDELLGRPGCLLATGESLPMEALEAREDAWVGEAEGLRADGSSYPVSVWSDVVRAGGRPIALITLTQDITEQKRADQTLRETREALQTLAEASPLPIASIGDAGRITLWNPAAERLFGWREEEVLGKADPTVLEGESWSQGLVQLAETAVSHGEVTRQTKGGERLTISLNAAPIRDAGGEQKGHIAIMEDVSSRRRMEAEWERLLRSEQQARAAAEKSARRAAFLTKVTEKLEFSFEHSMETTFRRLASVLVPELADGCVIEALDVEEEDGGWSRVAVAHTDPEKEGSLWSCALPWDLRVHSTTEPVVLHSAGDESAGPASGDSRPGAPLEARSTIAAPMLGRGRVIGWLVLARSDHSGGTFGPDDVDFVGELARRVGLILANEKLYHEAQSSTRTRDDVLAIVSHDLRSPLSVIQMSADAVLRAWPPRGDGEPERHQLQIVKRSAERMGRLIRDLLEVAKMQGGQFFIDPVPLDTDALLLDTVALYRPLAVEKGIHLRAQPTGGATQIVADQHRMVQALSNLVANAIQHTTQGGTVVLAADLRPDEVLFSVSDTGVGIPAEHLPHIFDRFWRPKPYSGTGLGLAITRGIVDAHGGRIWVESETGSGTTVFFSIPRPAVFS